MKVLLDENLDHALRTLLGPHEVVTTAFMGWSGLKNGELLRAAEQAGIEVLLTGDQTLNLEQNLTGRRLGIVASIGHSVANYQGQPSRYHHRDHQRYSRFLPDRGMWRF